MTETNEIKLKQKKIWNFKYKGFDCEVVNWNYEKPWDGHPSGNWNGYIYITRKQLPDRFEELLCKKEKTKFSSMPYRWEYYPLERIFEMMGGITFYEVIRDDFSGKIVAIKVGNDYMHSWDTDRHYDVEDVIRDLKKSVDTFIEHYPDYLVWNFIDGSYIKPELLAPLAKE